MMPKNISCVFCDKNIQQQLTGEPFLNFKGKIVCYDCYIDIIPEIYKMAGCGDGGLIHLIFESLLKSQHNRTKRISIRNYKKIFGLLCNKYKFKCVKCGVDKNLTIDHIKPVSKGGTDVLHNLQLMCRSCNSKKGVKYSKLEVSNG